MTTYYVDGAVGDDGNAGTSEGSGNAWATMDMAMNTVVAGDIVFVKASATYAETATIDTAGTTTAPILFVGYATTANRTDRGKVTMDATGLGSALADTLGSTTGYYVFENFKFLNSDNQGVILSLNQMMFRNCEASDNVGRGISVGNGLAIESCIFSNNGGDAVNCGVTSQIYGSRFLGNANGVVMSHGVVWGCTFYDIGGNAIEFQGVNAFACAVINCTIDGNAKNTTIGVSFPGSFWGPFTAINNIIYDCITGMSGHNNGGGRFIGRNNLMNSNTTDYANAGYETLVGEVTSAPAFEDEASQDYSLGAGSPALNAGFDGYETGGTTQRADIGAFESSSAGGAGGVGGNKRGNKQ